MNESWKASGERQPSESASGPSGTPGTPESAPNPQPSDAPIWSRNDSWATPPAGPQTGWTAAPQPDAAATPAGNPIPQYSPDPAAPEYPAAPAYSAPWTAGPQYQPYGQFAPAFPQAGPNPPRSGRSRIGLLVAGTALLSAVLSAAGTYVAFSIAPRQEAAPVQGVPDASGGSVQVVSLTQSDAIVRVVDAVKPSVVTIATTGTQSVGRRSAQFTGTGSGFIVSADGLIATNNHVVMNTQSLTVTLDGGRELPATVVKTDAIHDLALIKVEATGLKAVTLGDSSAIQVGQLAIAIGSPLGEFTDTVTSGIVSGLNRSITVGESSSSFTEDLSGLIQTDAAINPGNSGGPLLDAGGNVIGVVTAASSSAQDMGFAVPVSEVKTLLKAAGDSL